MNFIMLLKHHQNNQITYKLYSFGINVRATIKEISFWVNTYVIDLQLILDPFA